jgi:VWFA-related protein
MASLSHRQGWSFAVLLFIFPCALFAGANNDSPPVTYRTGTSEVRVTFFATDANNRPVETVNENEFAVVDSEMVIREFRSLARSDETALDIVLLVDASQSVSSHFQSTSEDVLSLVSRTTRSTSDHVSVVTFAGLKPAVLCNGDCADSEAQLKFRSITPAGSTPLFDSLAFTARLVSNRHTPGVRQIVIVFSDGDDTISSASPQQALEAIAATSALLYTIDVHSPAQGSKGKFWLQKMAEATGGRTFSLQDGTENIVEAVLADLRASYVVTYALPSRAAGFHSLRILPKHDLNLQFHCRRGYFYDEVQ